MSSRHTREGYPGHHRLDQKPAPSSTVLWVSGAGVGKSALMQRIAELDWIYFGGSVFFRRGNVKNHLFSTLAYQLAMNIHGMVEPVNRGMIQDFSLPKILRGPLLSN